MNPPRAVITAEAWNRLIPVGSEVCFFPVAGRETFERTRTCSEAWQPAPFVVLVKVEGRSGGVDVAHCLPVPTGQEEMPCDDSGGMV